MKIYLAGEYYKNMGNAIKQIVWGGGFPSEVNNETILSKPTHDTEIQKRSTNGDFPVRGGYA